MEKHFGIKSLKRSNSKYDTVQKENEALRRRVRELENQLQKEIMTKEKIHEAIRQHVLHTPVYGEK